MEIHQFACAWKFKHVTSSPRIVKNIVKKCNKNQDARGASQRLTWQEVRHNVWCHENSSFITNVTRVYPTQLLVNVTDKVKFKRQKKIIYDKTTKHVP